MVWWGIAFIEKIKFKVRKRWWLKKIKIVYLSSWSAQRDNKNYVWGDSELHFH